MNFQVDNIRIIESEYLDNFKFNKKLTEIELYGLEMALVKLLSDEDYKVEFAYNMVDRYTRHLEDCLDILNGRNDIMYIGQYKVLAVYLTVNGTPVLKCLKDEYDFYEDDSSIYYATIG